MTARRPVADRLWEKVNRMGPRPVWRLGRCWEWTAARDRKGYGMIRVAGRLVKPHRLAYELEVGPIPAGRQLDHLCRNHSCVRPSHLEPVTNRENALRGRAPSVVVHLSGVCRRGHDMAVTGRRADGECAECARARWKRWDRNRGSARRVA